MNIGIDIGGNHIGMGIVSEDGEILKKEIIDYENDEVTLEIIFGAINNFLCWAILKLKSADPQSLIVVTPAFIVCKAWGTAL